MVWSDNVNGDTPRFKKRMMKTWKELTQYQLASAEKIINDAAGMTKASAGVIRTCVWTQKKLLSVLYRFRMPRFTFTKAERSFSTLARFKTL